MSPSGTGSGESEPGLADSDETERPMPPVHIDHQQTLVGVVLRGSTRELPLARVACKLAGSGGYGLGVFAVEPQSYYFWLGSGYAYIDPEVFSRELVMQQRRSIRQLLELAGLKTKYTLSMVGRRRGPVVRQAMAEEYDALVLPSARFGTTDSKLRRLKFSSGPELVEVSLSKRFNR